MDALAARRILARGTMESAWRRWAFLARVPGVVLDSIVSVEQRLVVVAPHPDDEILACGGLIAMHAERGGDVLVVSVTEGEASHGRCGSVAALMETRRAERLEGLAALSLASPRVARLAIPDGEVVRHAEHLERQVNALLASSDVLVTTWRFDGHPDHEATGASVAKACATRGVRWLEAPVWMWNWARPGDPRVPWRALRGLRLTDIALRRKQLALARHRSQLTPREGGEGAVVDADMVARAARADEMFFFGGTHAEHG